MARRTESMRAVASRSDRAQPDDVDSVVNAHSTSASLLAGGPGAPASFGSVRGHSPVRSGDRRVGYITGAFPPTTTFEEHPMGEKTDQIKGNVKEAAGDLTGNKDLKNEGKVDKASGEVKEKVGDVVDKVKDVLHKD
jgi:uncharacterized protein YjbJ (UPF0337 family)